MTPLKRWESQVHTKIITESEENSDASVKIHYYSSITVMDVMSMCGNQVFIWSMYDQFLTDAKARRSECEE